MQQDNDPSTVNKRVLYHQDNHEYSYTEIDLWDGQKSY